jgi:hypothetical protein
MPDSLSVAFLRGLLARARRGAAKWKKLAKQQRKQLQLAEARIRDLELDATDKRERIQLQYDEIQEKISRVAILETEIEMLSSWTERWQAILEADIAAQVTRKVQAGQEASTGQRSTWS